MKKLIITCICFVIVFTAMKGASWAQLNEASFELEKVIANVYVGRQGAPLDPILGTGPGTYLIMNLYVIVSEDRSEVLLIDAPALPDLLPLFLSTFEAEFPGAEIKGILLTHDHIDHSGTAPYFAGLGIPVYASSAEINASPGMYESPIPLFMYATAIEPGFHITLGEGVVRAIDLSGHTPGLMGYAYYPDDDTGMINWLFAGDAVLAPLDHGVNDDPFNITYWVRQDILSTDTYSFSNWIDNLHLLKGMLTKHAKLFPGHGAVREGYLWQYPEYYIDLTIDVLTQ